MDHVDEWNEWFHYALSLSVVVEVLPFAMQIHCFGFMNKISFFFALMTCPSFPSLHSPQLTLGFSKCKNITCTLTECMHQQQHHQQQRPAILIQRFLINYKKKSWNSLIMEINLMLFIYLLAQIFNVAKNCLSYLLTHSFVLSLTHSLTLLPINMQTLFYDFSWFVFLWLADSFELPRRNN